MTSNDIFSDVIQIKLLIILSNLIPKKQFSSSEFLVKKEFENVFVLIIILLVCRGL